MRRKFSKSYQTKNGCSHSPIIRRSARVCSYWLRLIRLGEEIKRTPSRFVCPKSSSRRSSHRLYIAPITITEEEHAYLKDFSERSLSNGLKQFEVILRDFGGLFHRLSLYNDLIARHSLSFVLSFFLQLNNQLNPNLSVLVTHFSGILDLHARKRIVVPWLSRKSRDFFVFAVQISILCLFSKQMHSNYLSFYQIKNERTSGQHPILICSVSLTTFLVWHVLLVSLHLVSQYQVVLNWATLEWNGKVKVLVLFTKSTWSAWKIQRSQQWKPLLPTHLHSFVRSSFSSPTNRV